MIFNLKISEEHVTSLYESYVNQARKCLEKNNYNSAVYYAKKAAKLMYNYNLIYTDVRLEELITSLSERLPSTNQNEYCSDTKKVTLIDSFGLSYRGLAWIYAKGLLDLGFSVQYVLTNADIDLKDFQPLKKYLQL
ncbi:hypothetical protein [Adlercreutzia sp. ZJ304]|uniref:hypothetical protein n=1 Tax=Adlercreutzia sp. ZJ304 TaxID=2709791 RepID=UPI0013ED9A91|nr:hypothetical protein [Adlercreutzia sp. ZJ304]